MINFFYGLNSFIQMLIAASITLICTTFGASFVYMMKKENKKVISVLLGLGAGIMLAAAIFSLLLPAINESDLLGFNSKLIIPFSIIFGCIFLIIGDKFTSKYSNSNNSFLLIVSIILHNIPEGLSIGFAFGSITNPCMIAPALSLAIGIAIQNIPEGAAISLPLLNRGKSKHKSFLIGFLSGVVEPISAILGYLLVSKITILLPFLLAFAAGAMIFVVVKELIPESQDDNPNFISLVTVIGFVLMMLLEI